MNNVQNPNAGASVTRGNGLLERWLARLRARQAECLIPEAARAGRVLDIGCGSFPLFLSETNFAEKHGLERIASPEVIGDLAVMGFSVKHHDVIAQPALPYPDDYFDVVTMLAVFEHLERETNARLSAEILRVLKPGGRYVLTTPAAWTSPILRILTMFGLISTEEIDEHQPLYTLAEIRIALTRAGFDAKSIQTGHFEFGLNTWACARKL